jgi:lipoprotein NlpD
VWPASGKLIAKFSTKKQGNKGIDIAGNRNDSVRAAADGKVVYAGDVLRGYGKLIIVKHNDDYLSAYAHNDRILVKEQQAVKAGEVIAKMGDTDAKRVMLHFEVRFRGKSVNPLKYLPRR